MQFVDRALARRFESAEEVPQVRYAELYRKLRPEIGADAKAIGTGHMTFAGVGSPIGRVTGAGFNSDIGANELDAIEDFYRSHQAPSQVDVCPLSDAPLLEMLKEREYKFTEFNNVLYRRLDPNEDFLVTPGIRRVSSDDAAVCSAVMERSFFPDGNVPKEFEGIFPPLFQMEGAIVFLAEVEGRAAACGAGMMIPEHGIIALFGAGTLAEHRRRGQQTALLQTRMAAGAAAGCEFAVIVTQGGTTSQRNAERLGFRVAYSKATLLKEVCT